jgi:hypothetical protein
VSASAVRFIVHDGPVGATQASSGSAVVDRRSGRSKCDEELAVGPIEPTQVIFIDPFAMNGWE